MMIRSLLSSLLVAVVGLGPSTLAQSSSPKTLKYCPPTAKDVCYSVNVPSTPSTSSSSDLYFQIQGPSSLQWIALGQGSQMSGSNIFIVYSSADGKNVTLSPRSGKGHFEPKHDGDTAQVTLLGGSGIEGGMMRANVRCTNCATWSGGKMDLSSSNTAWIWAMKSGSPINSDDVSARLSEHDEKDAITLDLTKARGGDASTSSDTYNPFLSANSASSTATAGVAGNTATASSDKSGDDDAVEGASGSGKQKKHSMTIAHGVLMSLAFVLFFPAGAVLVRVLTGKKTLWIHSGTQFFAFCIAIAGMGLGVWLVSKDEDDSISHHHPVIGLTVLSALLIQLLLGHTHHFLYKRHQRRTLTTYIHIYWGRIAITLGIINGGLGLRWAGNTKSGEIAYGAIAGVVWVTWMGVAAWGEVRRRGDGGRGGSGKGSREKLEMQTQGSKEGSE